MYVLLHDRWHEGGTDDGRFPIYTYVRRGFQCSHLRRRGKRKLLGNLEDSRRRRKDKLAQVSATWYISLFFITNYVLQLRPRPHCEAQLVHAHHRRRHHFLIPVRRKSDPGAKVPNSEGPEESSTGPVAELAHPLSAQPQHVILRLGHILQIFQMRPVRRQADKQL